MPDVDTTRLDDHARSYEAAKLGIWIFLATELLLFGGLFTVYTVYRLKFPDMFYQQHLELDRLLGGLNTVVLICSSFSVAIGVEAIRRDRVRLMKLMYGLSVMLAGTFLVIKYIEYSEDFSKGVTPSKNIFFSLYFMMTALHAIHVIVGMTALTVVLIMAHRGRFSSEYNTPVEITGIYWHFVDIVWIYLFPLLYLIG